MSFAEARFRITAYFVVEWLLRIATVLLYAMVCAKGIYATTDGCSINPCVGLRNFIAYAVNKYLFFSWVWVASPDVTADRWYMVFFSGVGLCVMFLFLFTFYLDRKRRKLISALADAEHRVNVEAFRHPTQNRQSARNLSAGRDINLDQTINNYLGGWDKDFSNRPLGQIIIGAAGSLLAFLIGKLITS